jgi:formate dehydrogenase (coenzyme F420) beta subunit
MITTWKFNTKGDPLNACRRFLEKLWSQADLDGLLIPVYQSNPPGVRPQLIKYLTQLKYADPFAPLVVVNSAKVVSRLVSDLPPGRYAMVLRPCELRAVNRLVEAGRLPIGDWLVIGVDCLGSFDAEDFGWRLQKTGSIEALTRENLMFSRQGGIASYRFRRSCQTCLPFGDERVDLKFGLLGLPVRNQILVIVENEAVARRYPFAEMTDGPAEPTLRLDREELLETVIHRHRNVGDRMVKDLSSNLPVTLASLKNLLDTCAPCRKCLESCAIYCGELDQDGQEYPFDFERARRWVAACISCGMCEQACPKHLPIPAILARIRAEPVPGIAL